MVKRKDKKSQTVRRHHHALNDSNPIFFRPYGPMYSCGIFFFVLNGTCIVSGLWNQESGMVLVGGRRLDALGTAWVDRFQNYNFLNTGGDQVIEVIKM